MMNYSQDVEDDRLSKIKSLEEEKLYGDIDKNFGPNSLGIHELMDRASIINSNVYDFLLEHPSCIIDQETYHLTMNISCLLDKLYQQIGAKSLNQT